MTLPNPQDTWLSYQFLVVLGTWIFALSTSYMALKLYQFSKYNSRYFKPYKSLTDLEIISKLLKNKEF